MAVYIFDVIQTLPARCYPKINYLQCKMSFVCFCHDDCLANWVLSYSLWSFFQYQFESIGNDVFQFSASCQSQ